MACGHGPDICPHRDVAGELVEYQQKGVTLERHDIRAMAEAKAKARAEADATAKEEAEASSKETPALCANQEKLQLTYDAIVQVDGGKELRSHNPHTTLVYSMARFTPGVRHKEPCRARVAG